MDRLVLEFGASLPAFVLKRRFVFEDFGFMPLQQNGIFRPQPLQEGDAAVVLLSSVDGPYEDRSDVETGYFQYRYQGGSKDRDNWYNRALRSALEKQKPVLYLLGMGANEYMPLYPCYVINDNRSNGFVNLQLVNRSVVLTPTSDVEVTTAIRAYTTVLAKRRVHQEAFRGLVLKAYSDTCAVCSLKIRKLLDAAHIIPDGEERGDPIVQNGLALCKLHHEAYDFNIIGIKSSYEVVVSEKTMELVDGPMLTHGLKEVHGKQLIVPRRIPSRPDRERLEERFQRFLRQS
ncbi:MAG: HNH endonuclease [Ignavibacteria bacterium]|nr:HNH endonuclease [Ignavibacteria bacterium]